MEALEGLCRPGTNDPLTLTADGTALEGRDERYALLSEGDMRFGHFVTSEALDEEAKLQRAVYDTPSSRYAQQLANDRQLIRRMVDDYRVGRVKNKDALLRRAMMSQPMKPDASVMEIGCNDGRFLNVFCALHHCKGIGFDLSEQAIRRAWRARPSELQTRFHVADGARLPVAAGSQRCVISFDVFEHLGHGGVRAVLRECARVLEPGGTLLVYAISRNDRFTLHETFRAVSHGRVGVDAGEGHVYENFLHPDELRSWSAAAGFETVAVAAYHGFWTLFFEEHLGNRPPAFMYPWLQVLDFPLTKKERGNGFLFQARKTSVS